MSHHEPASQQPPVHRAAPRVTGSRPVRAVALLGLGGMLSLTACGNTQGGDTAQNPARESGPGSITSTATPSQFQAAVLATASVKDVGGKVLGAVTFTEAENDLMEVDATFSGMDPGYYGFHIHGNGKCEPDSSAPDKPEETGAFLSAGGHLGNDDSEHPDHAGDLPSLLVNESGDAHLVFRTDRLTAENLRDDDGSAVMVHEGRDNFANVAERYATNGPDEATLNTGDAGARLGCGVVEAG